jgi:nucleoid-associated protein YgaU
MSDFPTGSASASASAGGGVTASAGAGIDLSGASAGVELDFGGAIGSVGVSIDTNLKIIEMMMPINFVSFDYNPKSFSVTRKTAAANRNKSAGSSPPAATGPPAAQEPMYLGASPRTITFSALLSEEGSGLLNAVADMTAIGGGLRARCDMLMNWTVGGPATLLAKILGASALLQGLGIQNANTPPMLILQWGDPLRGFLIFGKMKTVKCDFLRFDNIGNPIRALVTCTFEEAASDLLSLLTNPTSGGEPGRQAHTMTQGENLQNVATERYGRPGAWREVAEANGIDDPMRVRPGQVLAMPPPHEIGR